MFTEDEVARSMLRVGDYVKYAKPGKVCGGYYECVELIADEVSSVATTVGAVWNRTSIQDFQVISAGCSADENISIARFTTNAF